MFRSHRVRGFLLIGLTAVIMTGCETSETDKLGAAQACLDKAAAATVNDCLVGIESVSNAQAYRIRCGGYFIMGGLDSNKFKSAFTELKANTGGGTGTSAMMAYLILQPSGSLTGAQIAVKARDNCSASGLSGMTNFGNLAYIATAVGGIASADTPAEMVDALKNFVTNGGSDSDLGGAVKSIATTGDCAKTTPPDYCKDANKAVSQCTTDAELGACTRAIMAKDPTLAPACCTSTST